MRFSSSDVNVLWLSGSEIEELLDYASCIELMEKAMLQTSSRNISLPLRQGLPLPNGKGMMGMMPGYLGKPECHGIKLVSLFPENHNTHLSSHMGLFVLFESTNGKPIAVMDGNVITAIRTAAMSALASKVLARKDSKILTIFGTGEQMHSHIGALRTCFEFSEIRIVGRNLLKKESLLDEYQTSKTKFTTHEDGKQAVLGADIICTVTGSKTPILNGDWIAPGTHINAVGSSSKESRELDDNAVLKSSIFIDYMESTMAQAGELIDLLDAGKIDKSYILGEVGDVLSKEHPGRTDPNQITLFKSLGVASQDLMCAHYLYNMALNREMGKLLPL